MTSSLGGYSGLRGPTGKVGNKTPSGTKVGQISQFTPEQQQLFSQLFSNVGPQSYLSRLAGGDESLFGEMEAPAMRQFNELLGGLGSRFSAGFGQGKNPMSARRSSGFQNAATAAASNFAQDLQSQRQALQRQAIKDLMGLSRDLLSERPYETFTYEKPKKGMFGGWGSTGGAVLGGIGGAFFGNPMAGAALGAGIGGALDQPSGGGQQMNFSNSGGFGNFRNPFSSGTSQEASFYDQLFRSNPEFLYSR